MKRRDFVRWIGTLGVAFAVTRDGIVWPDGEEQVTGDETTPEPPADFNPDQWYFASWWDPVAARLQLTCAKCGAKMNYKYTWRKTDWYTDHLGTHSQVIGEYQCSVCQAWTSNTVGEEA